jgi:hypothetical protein
MRELTGTGRRWQLLARALLALAAASAVFSIWALYQWVPQAGGSGSSLHTLGVSRSIRVIVYAVLWFGFTGVALGGWKALVLAAGRPSGAISAALWLALFAVFVIGLPVYVAVSVGTPSI